MWKNKEGVCQSSFSEFRERQSSEKEIITNFTLPVFVGGNLKLTVLDLSSFSQFRMRQSPEKVKHLRYATFVYTNTQLRFFSIFSISKKPVLWENETDKTVTNNQFRFHTPEQKINRFRDSLRVGTRSRKCHPRIMKQICSLCVDFTFWTIIYVYFLIYRVR